MQTVTLAAEDFRTIHNTLCDLRRITSMIDGVVNESVSTPLQTCIKNFESGLADAYRQDDAIFDRKMAHYGEFQQANGLTAIWSMYEVEDLDDAHPYGANAEIVYSEHWGDTHKSYPVQGDTWADVYRAADQAIRESGDAHHVFVEGFRVVDNKLCMYTGS